MHQVEVRVISNECLLIRHHSPKHPKSEVRSFGSKRLLHKKSYENIGYSKGLSAQSKLLRVFGCICIYLRSMYTWGTCIRGINTFLYRVSVDSQYIPSIYMYRDQPRFPIFVDTTTFH